MRHFMSALGLDVPANPDVRFYHSALDFSTALVLKEQLDKELEKQDLTTVIYRLSYDGVENEFYSSRQLRLDTAVSTTGKKRGNERYAGEPRALAPLAYEIFSVPTSFLTRGLEGKLQEQVKKIFGLSNEGAPDNGGP